jgi:hypothetical protein
MHLDDLEAMALIIDYKYDSINTGLNRCWEPFMTYDALVLMTLQSRNGGPMSYDPFYNTGACRQVLCNSVPAYI